MTNETRAILAAAFLLLPWQAQALDCGPMPEEVSRSIQGRTAEFLDSWWWKCIGEQSKLLELERAAKYPPAVLRKLDAREKMAWELHVGGKLTADELERQFVWAEQEADREAAQAARKGPR